MCESISKNHDVQIFIFFGSPNFGRARKIVDVDPHPTMHITVKKRMESKLKYKPKAKWAPGSEVYVD